MIYVIIYYLRWVKSIINWVMIFYDRLSAQFN